MKVKDVKILDRKTIRGEGFARIDQVEVVNIREDDTLSKKYTCDIVYRKTHDAVGILLYGQIKHQWYVVLHKQVRPIHKLRSGNHMFVGLPAGCAEEGMSLESLVVKEVREETGIELNKDQLPKKLGKPLYSSVGWTTEKIHFYAVYLEPEQLSKIINTVVVENISNETMEEGTEVTLVPLNTAIEHAECMMFEVGIRRLQEMIYQW